MKNVSFCHNVFKLCLLQRRQNASTCRKRLTRFLLQTTSDVSNEINTDISHDELFLIFQIRFAFKLRIALLYIKIYHALLQTMIILEYPPSNSLYVKMG